MWRHRTRTDKKSHASVEQALEDLTVKGTQGRERNREREREREREERECSTLRV